MHGTPGVSDSSVDRPRNAPQSVATCLVAPANTPTHLPAIQPPAVDDGGGAGLNKASVLSGHPEWCSTCRLAMNIAVAAAAAKAERALNQPSPSCVAQTRASHTAAKKKACARTAQHVSTSQGAKLAATARSAPQFRKKE